MPKAKKYVTAIFIYLNAGKEDNNCKRYSMNVEEGSVKVGTVIRFSPTMKIKIIGFADKTYRYVNIVTGEFSDTLTGTMYYPVRPLVLGEVGALYGSIEND